MLKKVLYAVLFFSGLLVSCSQHRTDEQENYTKQIRQYSFLLQPLSAENVFEINHRNDSSSAAEKEKSMEEYKKYLSFRFEIRVQDFNKEISEYYDKNDEKADYEQLLNYYLFGMQNDLKLSTGKGGEVPCTIYYFERNFDLTKSNRFMIGFKKPDHMNEATLTYDNKYLNIGKVNFQINKNDFTL